MTTDKLLDKIAEVLSTDAKLRDWCNSNFGKDPNIYIGIDQANPPAEEKCPVAAIWEVRQVRVPGSVEISWQVRLSAIVQNRTIDVVGNITKYVGFQQAERMRELMESALLLVPQSVALKRQGESTSIITYPQFESQTTVIVKALERGNV